MRDWKIQVTGKKNALTKTWKNFEVFTSIAIEVLATFENKDTVAVELKITVDLTEELYFVDVIAVNADRITTSIQAYLGRGDNELNNLRYFL